MSKKILIVDDELNMRMLLQEALEEVEDKGVELFVAANGNDAIESIRIEKPDLVILDVMMPGMDGIDLSNKATKIKPKLKVMFITGFAAVALGDRNPDHEKARVLSKPFHLKELVDQVEDLLAA